MEGGRCLSVFECFYRSSCSMNRVCGFMGVYTRHEAGGGAGVGEGVGC